MKPKGTVKLGHINTAKGYRGGERQTELLIRELSRYGYRQLLVTRRGAPLVKRFDDIDLEIREVRGDPLSVALACHDTDLIHAHEGRSVYGAWLRSLMSRTPYILTRHVTNPLGDHWLSHRAYRGAAQIAAVAPQVAELISGFDSQLQPRVIHCSTSDLPVDRRRVDAIRAAYPGAFLVGHVGALDSRVKGQECIIRVAGQLQETCPDIRFLLVGDGKDEAALKRSAAGLNNLTFVGFVENVGDYLEAFDLFILPSTKEGIGSILLDAMQRGLPIVASRVGGVPELVHDGENGILIEPARPDQLLAAIRRLHGAPELGDRMGERGRRLAENFTVRVMAEKYRRLYRSALGTP